MRTSRARFLGGLSAAALPLLLPAAARAATREQRQAETFGGGKVTADAGTKVKTSKSGDMWSVDVNEHEHYQISEAVISGG